MLTLLIAEAALETVPPEIIFHRQIQAYAKKTGKPPSEIILDKSYHYEAMSGLKFKEKRGRPDIVHFSLLEALGSPLNLSGMLNTHIHTIADKIIWVNAKVRLPRNYPRFIGLLEELFRRGRVPEKGEPLLSIRSGTVSAIMRELKPSYIAGFSRRGAPQTPKQVAELLAHQKNPMIVIGGFPHGSFTPKTSQYFNACFSIDHASLDAWIVVSRILAHYEEAKGITAERISHAER